MLEASPNVLTMLGPRGLNICDRFSSTYRAKIVFSYNKVITLATSHKENFIRGSGAEPLLQCWVGCFFSQVNHARNTREENMNLIRIETKFSLY